MVDCRSRALVLFELGENAVAPDVRAKALAVAQI
jgi:hypothetical protein